MAIQMLEQEGNVRLSRRAVPPISSLSQASAAEPSPSSLLWRRYSEPYKQVEPMVARVRPTATGCRDAVSDFRAFRNR